MELTFPAEPNPNDPPPPAIRNGITMLLTKDDKIFITKENLNLKQKPRSYSSKRVKL